MNLKSSYVLRRFNIRPRYFIIFVVVFSALYNVPRFFEYRTDVEVVHIPRPCIDPQVSRRRIRNLAR